MARVGARDRRSSIARGAVLLGAAAALVATSACESSAERQQSASGAHHGGGAAAPASPTATTPPPPPAARIAVSPASGASAVDPAAPVTVTAADGTLRAVTMRNPEGRAVTGRLSTDRRSWTSAEDLGYGKAYRVSALALNTAGKPTRSAGSFTTVTPSNQTAATIFPTAATGSVGVGTIVNVTFDEPITDKAAAERVMKVDAVPATIGAWHWMDDQRAEWRPAHYWRPGTRVSVDLGIYGAQVGQGLYGQEDAKASFLVHDNWYVRGNVNTSTLAVYRNGALVRTVPASFGKPSTPTHNGVHVIYEKYPVYLMNSASYGVPATAPGGYKDFPAYEAQRISGDGEFVHVNDGTIYAQGHENVSHGCINVSMDQGKWLYANLGVGDVVDVVGGDPELGIDDGYGGWNVPWSQWLAGSALHQ